VTIRQVFRYGKPGVNLVERSASFGAQ
jgi:hypothetical protein